MIAYPTGILTWPVALCVCVLDTWMVFALLLLAARGCAGERWNAHCSVIHPIVEAPVQVVQRRLLKWGGGRVPSWAPWAATFGATIAIRMCLVGLLAMLS
ncbi:MAG: hypothetical protein GY778_19830 [bacterium]|nr:hypothetical protein [bacterium]